MQNQSLPASDINDSTEYFFWTDVCFPVIPTLIYNADGPDKNQPDRLFIADRENRFILYFEKGYDGLAVFPCDDTSYKSFEFKLDEKELQLIYPSQMTNKTVSTGYFRITIRSDDGEAKNLAGSLSISKPENYIEGLENYSELYFLLKGLRIKKEKDGDKRI